jgi:hypothetical protein
MNVSLLTHTEPEDMTALCALVPNAAAKHAAAFGKARAAFLREIYGCQPPKGQYKGVIRSLTMHGTVVTVEIQISMFGKGMFEVPLHIFKKHGASITSFAELKEFAQCSVHLTAMSRYKFNGILLSNICVINLLGKGIQNNPNMASI